MWPAACRTRRCMLLRGDLAGTGERADIVERAVAELGRLDVLVDNVVTQTPVEVDEIGHWWACGAGASDRENRDWR